MNISTLLLMPAIGISQGSQPIIGFNHGAKEFGRIKETLKSGIITATALVTAGFMIARIWPTQLIGLFNDNPQLIELGTHAMKIFFLFLPLVSLQVISSSYFQAVGKPKQATLLSLSRQVLIFTPLVLILPHYWGLDGIWMAAPLADLGAFLIAGICLRRELKALNKSEIANKISPQPGGH